MKKFILFSIFLFLISFVSTFAQDEEENVDTTIYFQIGPYFSFKGGLNGGNILQGRKNGAAFNGLPDFGVSVLLPLSHSSPLGIALDLGYSSYAFKQIGWDTPYTFTEFFSYVSVSPSIYFAGFLLGLNFGIPAVANFGSSIDVAKLNLLSEVRLTYRYTIEADDIGSLNIYVQAGYTLTGIYKNFANDDPLKLYIPPTPPNEITNFFNPRIVSGSIGMIYLFNLFEIK
jgi:hypothetical protein